jgi:hypothetical protein
MKQVFPFFPMVVCAVEQSFQNSGFVELYVGHTLRKKIAFSTKKNFILI